MRTFGSVLNQDGKLAKAIDERRICVMALTDDQPSQYE
jgi:hypothetical protein